MGLKDRLKEKLIEIALRKRKGEVGRIVGVVIAVFVGLILAGATLPTAFQQIFGADTTGWTPSTTTLWQLIPLMGTLALVLLLVGVALGGFHKK